MEGCERKESNGVAEYGNRNTKTHPVSLSLHQRLSRLQNLPVCLIPINPLCEIGGICMNLVGSPVSLALNPLIEDRSTPTNLEPDQSRALADPKLVQASSDVVPNQAKRNKLLIELVMVDFSDDQKHQETVGNSIQEFQALVMSCDRFMNASNAAREPDDRRRKWRPGRACGPHASHPYRVGYGVQRKVLEVGRGDIKMLTIIVSFYGLCGLRLWPMIAGLLYRCREDFFCRRVKL